jgi:hypothetical protein
MGAAFAAGPLHRRSVVSGNIFNSNGTHVAVVNGGEVFDLDGQKIYELKGINNRRGHGSLPTRAIILSKGGISARCYYERGER